MVHGLSDVVGQVPGHFQRMYEVRGFPQDGVKSHEVRSSDARVPGVQIYCCGVGCVAPAGASTHTQRGALRNVSCGFTRDFSRALKLPFSTLGVGIVRQEHGQEPHEVVSHRPLLPTGGHGPTVQTGGIYHCKTIFGKLHIHPMPLLPLAHV